MKNTLVLIIALAALNNFSQVGGTRTYRFLDIPMTARAAALGGNNMSIWGDDINLIHSNPALLNPSMLKQGAFNYCNFVGDMNLLYAAYAHSLKQHGTAALSIQSYGYGKFQGYDELGNKTNTFKASDYAINLNYAKPMADSMFNIGVALKTIISQYDIYRSFGNAIDFGVTYHNKKDFVVSLVAKNVGFIWKSYSSLTDKKESLPNTVQFGISKKVPRAPFKLFFVYDQLLKWNIRYISPIDTAGKSNSLNAGGASDSTGFRMFTARAASRADNFMRHVTLGTEILITKNFHLRVAYNYRRQREMTLTERRGVNGLSLGFGLRIKRFGVSYSFSKMAFAGNSNIIGITLSW